MTLMQRTDIDKSLAEPAQRLDLSDLSFRYDPFPIGVARNVIAGALYKEYCEHWPPHELFAFKERLGKKYSLSEVNNPQQFYDFLRAEPVWRQFYEFVKSSAFTRAVLQRLCDRGIELGLLARQVSSRHRFSSKVALPGALLQKAMRFFRMSAAPLSARFEFSMLPAAGGHIKPHTDAPQKLITLVVSMMREGEWNDAWGGGTEVLRPKDITRNFNHINHQFAFEDVETIDVTPFHSNQCVVFVKTFNSFHAVSPMHGPDDGTMRKTLTINIESLG